MTVFGEMLDERSAMPVRQLVSQHPHCLLGSSRCHQQRLEGIHFTLSILLHVCVFYKNALSALLYMGCEPDSPVTLRRKVPPSPALDAVPLTQGNQPAEEEDSARFQ